MATPPDFSVGQVLTAAQMNAVGLWKVGTLTVTNATSGFTDTAFTSDFKNYRIMGTFSCSIAINLVMTLRDSGGDVTLGNYQYNNAQLSWAALPTWSLSGNINAVNFPTLARNDGSNTESSFWCDIFGPQTATRTGVYACTNDEIISRTFNGIYKANTQMVGFKLSATTAFTGTFDIYGYRD